MRRARKTTAPEAPPKDWPDALERFDAHLVELERSHHTREDYRDDLENFARWYEATFEERPDLRHLEAKELRQWKEELRERRKLEPASVNRKPPPSCAGHPRHFMRGDPDAPKGRRVPAKRRVPSVRTRQSRYSLIIDCSWNLLLL